MDGKSEKSAGELNMRSCKFLLILGVLVILNFINAKVLFSKDMAPEKPDIFLPSVVLEVEDLSVKNIVAPLPEEEILTPDVNFPLPDEEELKISKTALNIEPMPSTVEPALATKKGKLRTNTTLGVGTLNNFYSYISLYSFATKPEAKLIYEHETADGFSGKPSSIGYSVRNDDVHAGINYKMNRLNIEGDSGFNEVERGLQEESAYFSKINRFIEFNANVSYNISDKVGLFGKLENRFDSQRLTGGVVPYDGKIEYCVSPSVKAEYKLKNGTLGLKGYFGYRGVSGDKNLSLNRFSVGSYFDFNISDKNSIKGGVDGYWNSANTSYVPFYIGVQSTVNEFLSISGEGGYRLIINDLYKVFKDFPYVDIPATLSDSTEWYLNAGAMWIASEKWVFTSRIEFSRFYNKPGFNSNLTSNGLFEVDEYNGKMLSGNLGARWILNDIFSARFRLIALFGDVPENMNQLEGMVNLEGISKNGKFGGTSEVEYSMNRINNEQIPQFNLGAFYRINDYFTFSLEANDILQPIFNKKRYSFYPYLDRGFFLTIKTSVNF